MKRSCGLIVGFLLFVTLLVRALTAEARILVISPHPADDLITSAGIIYRA